MRSVLWWLVCVLVVQADEDDKEDESNWAAALASPDHAAGVHYQIGDWLNMPKFEGGRNPWQASWEQIHLRGKIPTIPTIFPGSVAADYFMRMNAQGGVNYFNTPNLPLLASILDGRASGGPQPQSSELVVHLRLGDMGQVSAVFRNTIFTVVQQQNPAKVTLLCGLHNNLAWKQAGATLAARSGHEIETLKAFLKQINQALVVEHLPNRKADDDLIYMRKAQKLVVHRGGFSALGAVVCQGMVYSSPEFKHYTWISPLRAPRTTQMIGPLPPSAAQVAQQSVAVAAARARAAQAATAHQAPAPAHAASAPAPIPAQALAPAPTPAVPAKTEVMEMLFDSDQGWVDKIKAPVGPVSTNSLLSAASGLEGDTIELPEEVVGVEGAGGGDWVAAGDVINLII